MGASRILRRWQPNFYSMLESEGSRALKNHIRVVTCWAILLVTLPTPNLLAGSGPLPNPNPPPVNPASRSASIDIASAIAFWLGVFLGS
jgi:hypothetical protein